MIVLVDRLRIPKDGRELARPSMKLVDAQDRIVECLPPLLAEYSQSEAQAIKAGAARALAAGCIESVARTLRAHTPAVEPDYDKLYRQSGSRKVKGGGAASAPPPLPYHVSVYASLSSAAQTLLAVCLDATRLHQERAGGPFRVKLPAASPQPAAPSATAGSCSLLPSLPSDSEFIDKCVVAEFMDAFGRFVTHHGPDMQRFMTISGGSDSYESSTRMIKELAKAQPASGRFHVDVISPEESQASLRQRQQGAKALDGPGVKKQQPAPPRFCDCCGEKEASGLKFKECSACRQARYCSEECQKLAWKNGHKQECKQMKEAKRAGAKEEQPAADGGVRDVSSSGGRGGGGGEQKKQGTTKVNKTKSGPS